MTRVLSTSNSKRLGAKRQGLVLVWAFVIVAAGCGGREGEVTGTVNYRGKPLQNGIISFFDQANNVVGTSSIVEGKYRIRNLPPGAVKITVATALVSPPAPAGAKDMPTPIESQAIPPQYDLPDQSGLTYEVKPGRQDHPIDLN